MKFDVIVGNPPYQNPGKSKGEKLWYRFIFKAYDCLNPDGIIAYVVPNSWMSGGINLSSGKRGVLKDCFKKYQLIESKVSGITGKYFKRIGIDISYFIAKKSEITKPSKIIIDDKVLMVDFRDIEMLSPRPDFNSI